MEAAMAKAKDLTEWYTAAAAMAVIGCSPRQLARYVSGEIGETLRVEYKAIPGRKPMPMYNPEDVQRLKAKRREGQELAHQARQEKALAPVAVKGPASLPADTLNTLAEAAVMKQENERSVIEALTPALEAFAAGVQKLVAVEQEINRFSALIDSGPGPKLLGPGADGPANGQKGRRRAPKLPPNELLVLTVPEAGQLGFSDRWLREQLRSGRLRNFGSAKRPKITRLDLDKAVAE